MSRKSLLLGLAGAALAGVLAVAWFHRPAAPQVAFTSLTGERITMAGLRGKVVLVNFWATDCPSCIREMPRLVDAYRKYHARGFETIAVAMSYDPPDYVLYYSHQNELPFPVALDIDGKLARAFGDVQATPMSFLIDRHGNIVRRYLGEPDFARLDALVDKDLQEAG